MAPSGQAMTAVAPSRKSGLDTVRRFGYRYVETCLIPNTTHTSYPLDRAAFSASSWAVSVLIERERCSKRKGGPPFFRTLSSTSV